MPRGAPPEADGKPAGGAGAKKPAAQPQAQSISAGAPPATSCFPSSTSRRQPRSNAFAIPFDRQQLADYLCVERSAMSAAPPRLREEG